ncbi:MAG: hypothetical protein LDL39_14115 [Magnetospirillum sp.]|nr:hypothetical protein [Magnetospirillum sp.]
MRPTLLPAVLALLFLTSACGGPPGGERPAPGPERPQALPLINTPTGEPLGRAQCPHAASAWFVRTDSDRDGGLSRAEFSTDAGAVFARLDRDTDGFVTPDELQKARMPFFDQGGQPEQPQRPRGSGVMGGDMPAREGKNGGGGAGSPDPVMTADSNLDFKVSRAEFAARNDAAFTALDNNADHRLSMDEVVASCPIQPTAPSRP